MEKDAFGRALKTYYPTTESIGANNTLYNAAVDSIEPTINKYDILDRVVYTKLPGENLFSTVTYGFGTDVQGRNMFQTVFKDELGGIKKPIRISKAERLRFMKFPIQEILKPNSPMMLLENFYR